MSNLRGFVPMRICAAFLLAAIGTLALMPFAAAQDKMTVLLDWFVNPDHAPLIIAQQGGFYEANGLNVTLVPPADPSAPPRLVAAGQGDIAITYQPVIHGIVETGLPLAVIGTLIATPLNSLIVEADGPIKKLQDLKGAKVGFSVSGFEDAMLNTMLNSVDLSIDDVELINVNFALTSALISGQVDAIIGGYRNFEMTQIAIEGKEGRAFYPEEHGVPIYDELIYVANNERLDDPRLERFLQAVEDATIFITNHPGEAWEMFIAAYPNLDDRLNRQAFTDTLPRFSKRPAALDKGRYRRFAAFLKQNDLLEKIVPPEIYLAPGR